MNFSGRVVVVTGATAGVGRATALAFAKRGARLALIARDEDALEETRAQIARRCGAGREDARCFVTDVADAEPVFEAARRIEQTLGPIDVWINNAMVTVFAPVKDLAPADVKRVTEVTYLGYVHGTMAALDAMRERNRGTIVQIGSALSYRGIPLQAAYCGAKHAIRGFTDSLRCELIHDKSAVRLVMVHLPAVNTPQFDWAKSTLRHTPRPVAPVINPEVVAEAVVTAVERAPREMWLGVSTIKTIVGNMLAPGMLDRILARRAVSGQETREFASPSRKDNLYTPVHGLHRVQGSFGDEAGSRAIAPSAALIRTSALTISLALGAAFLVLLSNWSRSRS